MIPMWLMVAALATGAYDPAPDELPPLSKAPGPQFQIPCKLSKLAPLIEAREIARVQLYVSANCGKTWEMYDEIGPDTSTFTFTAKRPGEYWFTARLKMKDGTLNPADPADFAPMQRVAVAAGIGSDPLVAAKRKPTAAEAASDLDDELTRVELELIRKELKRLSEMSELTPAAEDKLDRLRIRLRDLRDRLSRDSGPSANSPATSRSPTLLPPEIPSRYGDSLIPATNLPVAPMPRAPGRRS